MPTLARFEISNVRNIAEASLEPASGFNLIHGNNGSGKTSVLEALYLLGMGRSFRSHLQKPLIQLDKAAATVFGRSTQGLELGVQRPQRGVQTIKISGKPAEGLAQLSRCLPLQLINADTFQLLEGGPGERRHFLDWGVFHVEQQFIGCWRRTRQALEQRNSLIRAEAEAAEIEPWSYELAINAEQIDQFRQHYIDQLAERLAIKLDEIGNPSGGQLELKYWRGWDEAPSLFQQLSEGLSRDRRYGFTTSGPHKADIRFLLNGQDATELLSRGQLKLLICALKVVQAAMLLEMTGDRSLFLLDDLPAELDKENRAKVCQLLAGQQNQCFLTCIEEESLAPIALKCAEKANLPLAQFHVKHGKIDAA